MSANTGRRSNARQSVKPPTQPTFSSKKEKWKTTRSGPRSARGYHFQDAIAAWLATSLLSSSKATRIVPESWEDVTLEGEQWLHLQIKSRQDSRGPFSIKEVESFIKKMWSEHRERIVLNIQSDKMLLILEKPVSGINLAAGQSHVLTSLPEWEELHTRITSGCSDPAAIELLASQTMIQIIDEREACSYGHSKIVTLKSTYPAAAALALQAIRSALVEATDSNAASTMPSRPAGLTASDIMRLIDNTLELVDHEALGEAVEVGDCELVDFLTIDTNLAYYEGISAQPSHISAGLATERPDIVEPALAHLRRGKSVIFTGPSGIGKSTTLWLTARDATEIIWYRICASATTSSIQRIRRLITGAHPNQTRPVGLILDGISRSQATLWDLLVREAASNAAVILLGSVRTEDLFLIETREETATIPVSLDEETAANIHTHLRTRMETISPHWREAFEQAHGLTMEFTHILAKGDRLESVLTQQVDQRIRECREIELSLIRLVATADQWGASVPISVLSHLVTDPSHSLRTALRRLTAEHVLHEDNGRLRGMHQLRSRFLALAVHASPPPPLQTTVAELLQKLPAEDMRTVLIGALSENAINDKDVLEILAGRINESSGLVAREIFVAGATALREVEYRRRITAWDAVFREAGTPPPLRPIAIQLSMVNDFDLTSLVDQVKQALPQLKVHTTANFQLGHDFLEELGADFVATLLVSQSSISDAMEVLKSLLGTGATIKKETALRLGSTPLGETLMACSADVLGELLLTSYEIDSALYELLLENLGGRSQLLDRLREYSPWVFSTTLVKEDNEEIPHVRALYISEKVHLTDPERFNIELAKTVARLFPDVQFVDVRTLQPGELPIGPSDWSVAEKRLNNKYMFSEASIAWRQTIMRVAAYAYGIPSRTDRAALAVRIIKKIARFLQFLGIIFARGSKRSADIAQASEIQENLRKLLRSVLPVTPDALTNRRESLTPADSLHTLTDGVISNMVPRMFSENDDKMPLAAYVYNTLLSALRKVETTEDWYLVDFDPTNTVTDIDEILTHLAQVFYQVGVSAALPPSYIEIAKAGPSGSALARLSGMCREAELRRGAETLLALSEQLDDAGIQHQFSTSDNSDQVDAIWPRYELVIAIELSSILDWVESHKVVNDIVVDHFSGRTERPDTLIVPTFNGLPINQLCVRSLENESYPTELPEHLKRSIGAAHQTPLYASLTEALDCLDSLSGLNVLASYRDTSPLQGQRHQIMNSALGAVSRFNDLCDHAEVLAPLSDWLSAQFDRVLNEATTSNEHVRDGVSYAIVDLLRGVHGIEPSDSLAERMQMSFVALQYDIDPDHSLFQSEG